MKTKLLPCLVLVLGMGLAGCGTLACRSAKTQQWGDAIKGLQMSLCVLKTGSPGNPELQIGFQNVGTNDIALNLGFMLVNGNYQIPDQIGLNIQDGDGKLIRLHFFDRRFGAISGRVDPYAIPLRSGSTYTLKVRIDQFWSAENKIWGMKLGPGRYKVSAQFQGTSPGNLNSDMQGVKFMNFWKGELQSNVVDFEE